MKPAPDPIIHRDDHLIVVDKPAGLLSVPGRGPENADCVFARLQERFPGVLVVHRLDMATSGLLVFALGSECQRRLSKAFAARSVHKRYVAIVHGSLSVSCADSEAGGGWGVIDMPIGADWPNRPRQRVDMTHGKASLTRYRMIDRSAATDIDTSTPSTVSDTTRLLLEPLTGRTHQLRVHLDAIGHPIVGDALYGAPSGEPRLMLHASLLSFEHPMTGDRLELRSEPPF